MKYQIGDILADEDGNSGIVCIKWDDGDICELENDAAHPNPIVVCGYKGRSWFQKEKPCPKCE